MMWIFFILLMSIALLYVGLGTWITRHRFKQGSPNLDAPFNLYPVSILKPLKGMDSFLSVNLESFFNLDYPQYEILFSVANMNDPAIDVVEQLLKKYPKHKAKLIIGEIHVGSNPKINNLMKSYFESKFDLVLISDAQVRFQKEDLKNIVGHMDTNVGIVTSPILGIESHGIGGHIQALELTTFVSRILNFINYFNQPVVLGKTMLIKKSVATRFGGLRTLANYIAEDYYAGVAIKKLGLNVIVTSRPVREVVGQKSLSEYAHRFIRWGRIRRSQKPIIFLFEAFICSLLGPILGCMGLDFIFHLPFATTFSSFMIFHFISDVILIEKTNPKLLKNFITIWVLRQILNTLLYIAVHFGTTVYWKDRKIHLKKGGLIDATNP